MYTFRGTTDDVTACDQCGRHDLKSTVALETEHGEIVYFGIVCASHALKIPPREVRQRARTADEQRREQERQERAAAHAREAARWRAFLVSATGGILDWKGEPCTHSMIRALGGFTAARAAYREHLEGAA